VLVALALRGLVQVLHEVFDALHDICMGRARMARVAAFLITIVMFPGGRIGLQKLGHNPDLCTIAERRTLPHASLGRDMQVLELAVNFLTALARPVQPIDEAQIFCYRAAAFSTKLSTSGFCPSGKGFSTP
jgi:hypothetical protein